MISNVLAGLQMRLQEEFKRPVYIIDSRAKAIDKNVIYIISPRRWGIHSKPFLSNSEKLEFPISIYEVVHVIDVTRQRDVVRNIEEALNASSEVLDKAFHRKNNYRNICGANLVNWDLGTTSWVVNTKVYTAYELNMRFKMIYDD